MRNARNITTVWRQFWIGRFWKYTQNLINTYLTRTSTTMTTNAEGSNLKTGTNYTCGCTGCDGRKKKLYRSKNQAQDQADFARFDRQVNLSVYHCPYSDGFHLTSKVY